MSTVPLDGMILRRNLRDDDDAPQVRRMAAGNVQLAPGVTDDIYNAVRNTPPPGLVRVSTPRPISLREYRHVRSGRRRVLTNADVSIFSDFAQYIERKYDLYGNYIDINLTCSISGNRLKVLVEHLYERLEPGSAVPEPLAVLPCGHFFGYFSITDWINTRLDDGLTPDCPLCRSPLIYDACNHYIEIRAYDPRWKRRGQLPLTFPEGGFVPDYCLGCTTHNVHALGVVIAQQLYPEDIPRRGFVNPDLVGPTHFDEARHKLPMALDEFVQKNHLRYSHW
ncbi:hypothetical protein F5Y11DRAFT_344731 [Daldinia sp. FL1419]|nr:hypothetical protein F5Y11DRAFT_344731 [Daldinia sp. FL1419]